MKKYIVAILILSITLFVGCGKKEVEEVKIEKKNIVSEIVTQREMAQIFESDTVVEPKDKVRHSTEKGGTIEKIYKKNGDFVKKGDLVMSLSDSSTKASYMTAYADFQATKSSFQIAQGNYQKFKNLYDRGLVSHLEYVNYENAFIAAKGKFEASQALFQNAKSDYDKLERRADISGVVANLFGKEGNTVKSLEELFIVLNDKQMQAYIGLPGEYIAKVKQGDILMLHVDSIGEDYAAKIDEINPIADTKTKNFITKLILKNPEGKIKDGMYASITLPVGSKKVLAIPDEAIFVRNLLSYVFKVEGEKVKRIEVKTGTQNNQYTEISSEEIHEGDRIVVKGLFGLQDGDYIEENKTQGIDKKEN